MLRVISQSQLVIHLQDQIYSPEDVLFFARLVETCWVTSDQGWRKGDRPATTGRVLGAQREEKADELARTFKSKSVLQLAETNIYSTSQNIQLMVCDLVFYGSKYELFARF